MQHIVKKLEHNSLNLFDSKKLHPFVHENLDNCLVFDIETTGLHHRHAHVILIGYLYKKNNEIFVEQIFAETPLEEKEILHFFAKFVGNFDYLISYNGNTFDIPFLNSRLANYNIDCHLDKSMNIDLLRVARQLSKTLDLENYKLKTVEEFLGIYREDAISGKESVELYNQYVAQPSESLRNTILLHNYEDILYLGKVVDLLSYLPQNDQSNIPIRFTYNHNRYYIAKNKISKDFLITELFSRDLEEKRVHFSPSQLTFEQTMNHVFLKAPIFKIETEQETLSFIDIDLITDSKISFNDLGYDEKISYLVSQETLGECIKKLYDSIPL